jgi:hypothetical protein
MSSLLITGIGILTLFAGVSLIALYSRRVGNSNKEAATLLGTAALLVIAFLCLVSFVDRFSLGATERSWALRGGFVVLTVILWRASRRIAGGSAR